MCRISLIIPAYNAEKTLKQTLLCLDGQLQPGIEVFMIDDGSTDATSGLLDQFALTAGCACHVIHQENAGVAAARNRAIQEVSGDYLVFLDADDAFPEGALTRILNLTESGADIIGWDWMNDSNGKLRPMRQANYGTPEAALKNLMGGTMKWNLWLYAIKQELVIRNNIQFIPGADMGEDMAFMLKAFSCAKQVLQVHEPLYSYNAANPASISVEFNERRRSEVTRNLNSASTYFTTGNYAELFRQYLPHLKLFIKLPLLIGFSFCNYRLWFQWMKEANGYAMKNKALPFRIRLLQGMASLKLWPGVWLYNCLYRFLLYFK